MTPGFLTTVTDILKGVTRQVPARMAIEHAVLALAQMPEISWCGLVLAEEHGNDCIALAGRAAKPSHAEIVELLEPLQTPRTHVARSARLRSLGARDGELIKVMGLRNSAGEQNGWLICALDNGPHESLASCLELMAWLLSSALAHDRVHSHLNSLDRRHLAVIESLPHVIYEAQLEGELLYLSPKIEALCGYRPDEIGNGPDALDALVHPEDRPKRQARIADLRQLTGNIVTYDELVARIEAATNQPMELRLMHRNRRDIIWVADHFGIRMRNPSETLSSSFDSRDFVLSGALIDLRERKRLETEGLQQSRLATIGELAAGVAHEVNNPLTAVLTYSQLLERLLARSEFDAKHRAKVDEYLKHILEQGRAIYEITRNLTGFVRKDGDESFQAKSVSDLIKSSIAIFRYPLRREQISLTTDIPVDLPLIRARGRHIRQVLLNLVANARASVNTYHDSQLSPARVKAIHISAQHCADDPELVRISVTDFGEGVPEEHRDLIFDAFFTTRKDGTGLGLSISNTIVREHDGTLGVRSGQDGSTTFNMDLPIWSPRTQLGARA